MDRLVSVRLRVGGLSISAYRGCGIAGAMLAATTGLLLARRQGLEWSMMAVLTVASVGIFFALAWGTKLTLGEERLTYYHHQIAILVVSAATLAVLRHPVLAYLDIVMVSLGVFLACGRVGCFLVGCCHGRPGGWGVCYRQEHGAAGFPVYLVGVRLWPVQLLEALWVAAVVAAGMAMLLGGSAAGAALAWCVLAYGCGRFALECLRGDPQRPYLAGVSEAQWTSLLLVSALVVVEWRGLLPWQGWHGAAWLALLAATVLTAATDSPRRRLRQPWHVRQLAQLLALPRDSHPQLGETALGIRVSASTVDTRSGRLTVFAFSGRSQPLEEGTARRLARLAMRLTRAPRGELAAGNLGVYHLLIPEARSVHAV